ncbi:MAG: DUF6775 family putative metallopeptidase [Thermodesulfobacteriota bacterium]
MGRRLTVFIYTDHPSQSLDTDVITGRLEGFGISSENRGDLFEYLGNKGPAYKTACLLARSRITDVEEPLDVLHADDAVAADSELRKMSGIESVRGMFYDGLWMQRILRGAFGHKTPGETWYGHMHMIFTGRLFGTYDGRRYHARVLLAGSPALISTSGLVEAPARPREYYFIKGGLIRSGRDTSELDRMYRGRYVEYDDPKTSRIIGSYALQAVYYELTGNEFCGDAGCCLYNSHWQEEVLKAQYEGDVCEKCLRAFTEKIREE